MPLEKWRAWRNHLGFLSVICHVSRGFSFAGQPRMGGADFGDIR